MWNLNDDISYAIAYLDTDSTMKLFEINWLTGSYKSKSMNYMSPEKENKSSGFESAKFFGVSQATMHFYASILVNIDTELYTSSMETFSEGAQGFVFTSQLSKRTSSLFGSPYGDFTPFIAKTGTEVAIAKVSATEGPAIFTTSTTQLTRAIAADILLDEYFL